MASLMTGASLPVPSRSLLRFLRSAALPGTGRSCPATHRKFGSSQANPRRKHSTSSPRLTITPPILAASLGSPARISPRPSHSTPLLARPTPPNRRRFSIKPSPPKAKDAVDQTQSDGKSWQEKLWGFTARRGAKPLRPDDLPGHHENCDEPSMFHSRRTMAAKAALEPRLRCTEVDETGNVIMVDGEFKKTELIAKVSQKLGSPLLPTLRLSK